MKSKNAAKWVVMASAAAAAVIAASGFGCGGKDQFTDKRDRQRYRTVTIGTQTWMAQNLNYAGKNGDIGVCYENSPDSCAKYGRLYDWRAALTACPAGWRLPDEEDWDALIDTAGGKDSAGTKLKSKTGWRECSGCIPGTDDFGFSARPGGYGWEGWSHYYAGDRAGFWSATEYDVGYEFYEYNFKSNGYVPKYFLNSENGWLSVRCLKIDTAEHGKKKLLKTGGGSLETSPLRGLPYAERDDCTVFGGIDTVTDMRDCQIYRTVTIGEQTWMAENLNYDAGYGTQSWCYEYSPDSCAKYGRLYDWEAAMSACPEGWRLPGDDDWEVLINTVGGEEAAGTKLKSKTGWSRIDRRGPGTDDFGFSAMPGGEYRDNWVGEMEFYGNGYYGNWWTATEYGDHGEAYFRGIGYRDMGSGWMGKRDRLSVRCLKIGAAWYGSKDIPKDGGGNAEASAVVEKNICTDLGETGVFNDERDGQTYRAVVMPDCKTWMAENLNYAEAGSWCYNNSVDSCAKYGRLYDWNTAMKACPAGWRLPSDNDWTALTDAVGDSAGAKLKSKTGWRECSGCIPGTDDFGFSALPGGYGYDSSSFYGNSIYRSSQNSLWWSATENDAISARSREMRDYYENLNWSYDGKTYLFSARCVRE